MKWFTPIIYSYARKEKLITIIISEVLIGKAKIWHTNLFCIQLIFATANASKVRYSPLHLIGGDAGLHRLEMD